MLVGSAQQAVHQCFASADTLFAGDVVGSAFKDRNAVIKVHGERCPRELGGRQRAARPVRVQLIDQMLAQLQEAALAAHAATVLVPVGGVQVLHHVDAIARSRRSW